MNTKSIIVLAISVMLFGCASFNYTDAPSTMGVMYSKYAYLGYEGGMRAIDEVGIVTTDGLIQIGSLDGQPMSHFRGFKDSGLYSGGRYQLHLLPGTHTITMGFHDDRGNGNASWSTSSITKILSIGKGQVIHLSLAQGGRTWTAKESDGSSAFPVIAKDFKELSASK